MQWSTCFIYTHNSFYKKIVTLRFVTKSSSVWWARWSWQLASWSRMLLGNDWYGACTGCQSGSGSTSNSPNCVTWLLLSNSQATSLIWSAHTVSLACCDHPHRSFCQFRRTTWTLLDVVSLLLLRDFGTLFHWTVELLHPLTHLRSISRHFSSIRHSPL